ncbi:MAG: tryptophan synthase subunit alpha, partial [Anaerolineales bacterium]|nr:tryptophan synthase subunit alpha [Anaerolineales bacterium]
MPPIETAFTRRPAFMPYFPLGYPTPEVSLDVIAALARGGASLIEVGLPFSDPLADGPVIQRATQIALQQGMTVARALAGVRALRARGVSVPLVLMGYYNPLLAYGLARLAADAAAAGADGFIVPDLPPEEAGEFEAALRAAPGGLPLIRMLAPTTPPERAERAARGARGFIYLVSVTGVTGARSDLPAGLPEFIGRVRAVSGGVPLCVGFGIATPEQGRAVGRVADGIIVGSACVKAVGEAADPARAAEAFARRFAEAL